MKQLLIIPAVIVSLLAHASEEHHRHHCNDEHHGDNRHHEYEEHGYRGDHKEGREHKGYREHRDYKEYKGHKGYKEGQVHHGPHGNKGPHGYSSPAGKLVTTDTYDKVINVELLDTMQFKFETDPDIKAGESIKFVVHNAGNMPHEFSIGTAEEQEKHRLMMQRHPNMHHADGNTVTVAPGKTETLIWQFGHIDSVAVACNIPGHSEAGMRYTLELQTD